MQYELSALERSVLEQINQVTTATNKKNEDIQKETERIKDAFLKELFSVKIPEAFYKYVQIHQKGLVLLIDRVYDSRQKDYESDKTAIKAILKELEGLLTHLENHFHEYLSMGFAIPAIVKERELTRFHQSINLFAEKLKEFDSPQALTALILEAINVYTDTEGKIYYYQFYFFRELENILNNLERLKEDNINPHRALIEALCRINFNSLYFFHYCKDCVFGFMMSRKDISQEVFYLKRFISISEEIQSKPGLCYNPSKAHITELLKSWITDTMYMKEKYLKEELEELENLKKESVQKMTTTLTVAELALITRLFIEGAVFVTKNKKVLSHFMTKNFVTIQKDIDEESSVDHFYNSLAKIKDVTAETVEAILNRMKAKLEKIKSKGNSD